MMDTNNKKLEYAQSDLFKAIISLEDKIKDSIREMNIYDDVYKDYLKKAGVRSEANERLKDRVSFIQNKLQELKEELDR